MKILSLFGTVYCILFEIHSLGTSTVHVSTKRPCSVESLVSAPALPPSLLHAQGEFIVTAASAAQTVTTRSGPGLSTENTRQASRTSPTQTLSEKNTLQRESLQRESCGMEDQTEQPASKKLCLEDDRKSDELSRKQNLFRKTEKVVPKV